jgi:hypothetical protein
MWTIQQQGTVWQVLAGGEQVGGDHASYDDALAAISDMITAQLAEGDAAPASTTGMLPERWHTTTGVAFSEDTGDGRDFTGCAWSFRDPAVYALPLMSQTETEIGHFGAVLAGFADTVDEGGGTPTMAGGFYDSEAGRALRDRMLAGRTGVSVDPGEVEAEFVCTEYDDDGWCNDGVMHFLAYQIIGVTDTPFPAFSNATIELEGQTQAPAPDAPADDAAPVDDEAVAASFAAMVLRTEPAAVVAGAAPVRPPSSWFSEPEPDLGDPRLIEQPDGSLAVPLTITDDGQVYGHVARWGQCHVGDPAGPGVCIEPPESTEGYPDFHLGHVVCDDGEDVPTGVLVAGCDHPAVRLAAPQARDHYAHNAAGWADVVASNGQFGPWVCGALRPDVTELQLRVLRASSLSGDWRPIDGRNEMITAVAVNVPGFPISRRALVASGMRQVQPAMAAHLVNGEPMGIVASGIVMPCPECARRNAIVASAGPGGVGMDQVVLMLAGLATTIERVDRRTQHLAPAAAEAYRTRLARHRQPS